MLQSGDLRLKTKFSNILSDNTDKDTISSSTSPEILIIDDEPENLRLIKGVLGKENYRLRFAPNGHMAIASIKRRLPDLILLDIMMPGLDGYEVCRQIKSNTKTRQIPVIHLTALRETHNLVESFNSGAVDFIPKPFDNEVLKARVRTHLKLHHISKNLSDLNQNLDKKVKARTQEIMHLFDFQRAIVDSAAHAIISTDQNLKITSVNNATLKLFGQKQSFFEHLDLTELFPKQLIIRLGEVAENPYGTTASSFAEAKSVIDQSLVRCSGFFESVIKTIAGISIPVGGSLATFSGNFDGPTSTVMILNDISLRKKAESKIEYNAFHDFLTDLPNRRLLIDRLNQAIEDLRRSGNIGAILFVDLDDFKLINDSHGHSIGDLVLKKMAHRLQDSINLDKRVTISRFGGDEFVILLDDIGNDHDQATKLCAMVGDKLLNEGSRLFKVNGVEFKTTTSVGIRLFSPKDNINLGTDDIIRQADMALYKAKDSGKNCYHFFCEEMQHISEQKMFMIQELHNALASNQFHLYYQPIVDAKRNLKSAECLIRWIKNDGTIISPAEFIPLAEESGQILPISRLVLNQSSRHFMKWQQATNKTLPSISINISARQFCQSSFFDELEQLRSLMAFKPRHLILEITESVVMSDSVRATKTLSRLKDAGYHIALDDFGTGYSSLSYLKDLPIDQLKIDRSFIRDINSNHDNEVFVEAICTMAHQLGLEIIAEGLETEEQFKSLKKHGCHFFQGFLFAKPMPQHDFEKILTRISPQFKNGY